MKRKPSRLRLKDFKTKDSARWHTERTFKIGEKIFLVFKRGNTIVSMIKGTFLGVYKTKKDTLFVAVRVSPKRGSYKLAIYNFDVILEIARR